MIITAPLPISERGNRKRPPVRPLFHSVSARVFASQWRHGGSGFSMEQVGCGKLVPACRGPWHGARSHIARRVCGGVDAHQHTGILRAPDFEATTKMSPRRPVPRPTVDCARPQQARSRWRDTARGARRCGERACKKGFHLYDFEQIGDSISYRRKRVLHHQIPLGISPALSARMADQYTSRLLPRQQAAVPVQMFTRGAVVVAQSRRQFRRHGSGQGAKCFLDIASADLPISFCRLSFVVATIDNGAGLGSFARAAR